ncbi:C40 family peptidase [Breznakiella homolactica]|uniref:C40 family peptidase n=1 Tax=Breznakiella homolactica TaxID=2798577 RepID=A0A7T8BA11_9SPIR|nr:C40 family peptidase [Breznakiella homolactica]QQO10189.1 C40 family peptidase [Breznakiella homolactica]
MKFIRKYRKISLYAVLFLGVSFSAAADNTVRQAIIETAKQYLGVPYVYGAESPEAFDCSGFVRYVYRTAANITVPRTSKTIWSGGQSVRVAAAQPGDIIVFDTVGGAASHVAIILDNETMIHAVSSGPKTGVIISPLQDRYFAPKVMGVRSFIAAAPERPGETPSVSAPAPAGPAAEPLRQDLAVESLGFTITNEPVIFSDKIPAATGSGIQFVITNGTGSDGTFEILFYKMDPDPSKHKTLRQIRVSIKAGRMVEMAPFVFTEPGQYRLILKTHNNLKRVERTWQVVEL